MPIYIYIEDINDGFKHINCNKYCAELWGKPIDEIIGKSDEELFTNCDEIKAFRETDLAVAQNGELRKDILPITGADGIRRIGKFYRQKISFPDGRNWLLGIVFDVTKEEEQKKNIDSLLNLFEYSADLAQISPFRFDIETCRVDAPKHFSNLWPLCDGKAIPIEEYVMGEDYEKVITAFKQLENEKIPQATFEFRSNYYREVRYFRTKMRLEKCDGKKQFVGIIQDVTDLTNDHLKLQSTLALQDLIINTVPVVLFAKDISDGFRYVIANRNTEKIMGAAKGGLIGKKDTDFNLSDFTESIIRNDRMLLDSHSDSATFTETATDAYGTQRVFKMTKKIYSGENGKRLLLGIGSDITEQMELIENQKVINECFSEIMIGTGNDSAAIILGLLCNRLKASRAFMLRFDCKEGKVFAECEYRANQKSESLNSFFPVKFSKEERWFKAMLSGRPIAFPNINDEIIRAKFGEWDLVHQRLNVKSIYESKIIVNGELWGLFGVSYENTPHEFTPNEREFFSAAANVVGIMRERHQDREKNESVLEELRSALSHMEWGASLTQSSYFYLDRISRKIIGTKDLEKLYPHRNGQAMLPKDWILPDDLDKVQHALDTIYTGNSMQTTFDFRSSYFGGMRYFRVLLRRDLNAPNNMFFGIIQDITVIMVNAIKLKESQQLCELSINAIPSPLFIHDIEGEKFPYLLCNKSFSDFFGINAHDIIGKTLYDLPIPEEQAHHLNKVCARAATSESEVEIQESVVDKNGDKRLMQMVLKPFSGVSGKRMLIGSCVDITDMSELVRNEKINATILSEAISIQEFNTVLSRIFATLTEILHCDHVLLVTRRESGDFKLYREHCAASSQPVGEQICQYIFSALNSEEFKNLKNGKSVFLDDITSVSETKKYINTHSKLITKSCAVSPILFDDKFYGVLIVTFNDALHFRTADENLMKSMCSIIHLLLLRERHQRAIKEAEEQNRAILDNINIPLWLYNRDGVIIKTNKAASKILSVPISGNTPYSCRNFMHCGKSEDECVVQNVFKTGKTYHGKTKPAANEYLVDTCPVKDSEGNVVLAVKSFFEVTKLNRLVSNQKVVSDTLEVMIRESEPMQAIRSSLERIREYAKASLCFVFQIDSEKETVSCFCENSAPESCSIFESVQNHPWGATPSWSKRFEESDILEFRDFSDEKQIRSMSGWRDIIEGRDIRSCYACRIILHGKLWGFFGLIYEHKPFSAPADMLDFFRASAHCIELLLIRKEYREDLLKAVEVAQTAEKAKSTFLASMSHEIRTPLNAIIGFAELLKGGHSDKDEINDYLGCIAGAGNSLLALINDILDISKLEAGQMSFKQEMCDFLQLTNEVRDIFKQKCKERGIHLYCDIPHDFPMVKIDKLRIRQILFNLIGNAVKFTDIGSITIHATFIASDEKFGDFSFDVTDTGIGISESDQKKLFNNFVQAEGIRGTMTAKNGTGLGLALCRRMVEKMDGKVYLESTLGKGSKFRVVLEKIEYTSFQKKTPQASGDSPIRLIGLNKACTVLLVDDVPMNLKVLEAMLRKLGAKTATAINGEDALKKLSQEHFDLVMTDLWMPVMDGSELSRRMRLIAELKNIPVVAITADAESDNSFDISIFNEVVTKPVSLEKIVSVINKILTA